jgi:hypothetical protein
MDGKASAAHLAMLTDRDCDVWLLTEVPRSLMLDGYTSVLTEGTTFPQNDVAWAGVFARHAMAALPQPHGATVAAQVNGHTYWSSVLPWRDCARWECAPWWHDGADTADRMRRTLQILTTNGPPDVWGGDFNQELSGRHYVGTEAGRRHLEQALEGFGLTCLTRDAPGALADSSSIDHVAARGGRLVAGVADELWLSAGHDVYVAEIELRG